MARRKFDHPPLQEFNTGPPRRIRLVFCESSKVGLLVQKLLFDVRFQIAIVGNFRSQRFR